MIIWLFPILSVIIRVRKESYIVPNIIYITPRILVSSIFDYTHVEFNVLEFKYMDFFIGPTEKTFT